MVGEVIERGEGGEARGGEIDGVLRELGDSGASFEETIQLLIGLLEEVVEELAEPCDPNQLPIDAHFIESGTHPRVPGLRGLCPFVRSHQILDIHCPIKWGIHSFICLRFWF